MESLNWAGILSTAIIPLLVSIVYYHPKVLGTAAARAAGIPESEAGQNRRPIWYLYMALLGLLLSMFMMPIVMHASHISSLVANEGPDSQAATDAAAFLQKYSGNFRTFKHGVLHGIIMALLGAWPMLAITAMPERRGWRYVAIHLGYWVIVFGLVGGAVCALA